MEKKFLTSVSLFALLFSVSCGAFKPDHPQIYKSFKERRLPKENELAASGELGKAPNKEQASFKPYNGKSVGGDKEQASNDAQQKPQGASSNTIQAGISQATSATAAGGKSLIDKLLGALNLSSNSNTNLAANSRRLPQNNVEAAAYADNVHEAQGSLNSYSYYELAEDISSHQTTEFGKVKPTALSFEVASEGNNLAMPPVPLPPTVPTPPATPNVAAPVTAPSALPPSPQVNTQTKTEASPSLPSNSAKPMVTIPNEPSVEELKNKTAEQPKPDLKNVPPVPEEFKKSQNSEVEKTVAPANANNNGSEATNSEQKQISDKSKAEKVVSKKGKNPIKKKIANKSKKKKVATPKAAPVKVESGEPNADAIRDADSQLEYIQGRPVVTGFLDRRTEN